MRVVIRDLEPRDAGACDAIVAGLPEWFGNEQGILDCAHAIRSQAGMVAIDEAEQVHRLDVKTLSERATYPPYAETRAFYLAEGFESVAELDIWDEGNPAVLLRRCL